MMPQASIANSSTQARFCGGSGMKNSATIHTHSPTAMPRTTAAST
ncbi:Uncharacterised protein [Bordetella pertussis]|nr:Uncharacterised protein [Bordetella pertussis]